MSLAGKSYTYRKSMMVAEMAILFVMILFGIPVSVVPILLPRSNPKGNVLMFIGPIWTSAVVVVGYVSTSGRRTFKITLLDDSVEWTDQGRVIACPNSELVLTERRSEKGRLYCSVSRQGSNQCVFGRDLPDYAELVAELRLRADRPRGMHIR